MSYDFNLAVDVGRKDGYLQYLDGFDMNYTYNVSNMFEDALPGNDGVNQLNEMECSKAIPILEQGIKKMTDSPEHYKKMEPDNGWGTYDGALNVFKTLLEWCRECPLAMIVIS